MLMLWLAEETDDHCGQLRVEEPRSRNRRPPDWIRRAEVSLAVLSSLQYRVAQKIGTVICVRYNFIKYRPIFKHFSLLESGENL